MLKYGIAVVVAAVTGGLMSSDRLSIPFDSTGIAQHGRGVTRRLSDSLGKGANAPFVRDGAKRGRRRSRPLGENADGADSPFAPRRRRATHGVAGCETHFVGGVPPAARRFLSLVAPGPETTNQSHAAEYVADAPSGTEAAVELCHNGHLITRFNVARRLPEFAAYKLTAAGVRGASFERPMFLPSDGLPLELQPNAHASWGRGQSRGHLCPKSALLYSMASQDATFDFTNIVPQVEACNGRAWAAMERALANWVASTGRELYVITGIVLPADGTTAGSFSKLDALNIKAPEYIWTVFCDAERGVSGGFYGKASQAECGSAHATHTLRTVREIEQLYGGGAGRAPLFPSDVCNTDADVSEAQWKFSFT